MDDELWFRFEEKYEFIRHDLRIHMNGVRDFFGEHPHLNIQNKEIVHSTKLSLKSKDNLRKKIDRKISNGNDIRPDNLFSTITDLAGVRVILLFQQDFSTIHSVIDSKISGGDWHFAESPKAFTWDPEKKEYFEQLNIEVETRETSYTSVHYLINQGRTRPYVVSYR